MTPIYVHVMNGLGIFMILIYARVLRAVQAPERSDADPRLAGRWQTIEQIRQLVRINLSIGLIMVIVASGGRYLIL